MGPRTTLLLAATAVLATAMLTGCAEHKGTLAPTITDPYVFDDNFGANVDFQAFGGSKLTALSIDSTEKHRGTNALKISVPAPGDPAGGYAGGAFTTNQARDLTSYDALTFWARSNRPITMDVGGLGNDNTGTSKYQAKWANIPISMTWTKYVIPIPLPAKLTAEKGLFFFAEGPESGAGSTIWFDDVVFENSGIVTNTRPAMVSQTLTPDVGASVSIPGTTVTFSVGGNDELIEAFPSYFSFTSSNDTVATVGSGVVNILSVGTAVVTARLGTMNATGALTLNTNAAPTTAAPTPGVSAANVISLFSNAYPNVAVDTWSASWDAADVADVKVAGNDVKKYSSLVYAGVECTTSPINASAMTAFHMDVWLPKGTTFKVKLVDFGANGIFGGGDDSEQELSFNATSTPAIALGSWFELELPLSSFTALLSRAHLAQMIISGDAGTVYLDNVYFHK